MRNPFVLLWIVGLISVNLISCDHQIDSLATNSKEIEKLQNKLAIDPVFKAYDDAFKYQMDLVIAQRYSKETFNKDILKAGMKDVHSKEDYYKLCEKAGIVNPEKNLAAHYHLMLTQKALYKKYPELKNLSKDDFKRLMFKFSQAIASKTFPKSRFTKSAN